jgi:hypothetical protein
MCEEPAMEADSEVTAGMIRRGLAESGLPGRPTWVRSSLKSFGELPALGAGY